MSIHPAVAPSGATGLAGSLMRRHCRLLWERFLTRQFLSASGTASQVGGEREKKERDGDGIRKNTYFFSHIFWDYCKNFFTFDFTLCTDLDFIFFFCIEQREGCIAFHNEIIKAGVINGCMRLSARSQHKH